MKHNAHKCEWDTKLLHENQALKAQRDKLKINETKLKHDNVRLRYKNNDLLEENMALKQYINNLREEMQHKFNKLQAEFDEYKEQHKQLDLLKYSEWSCGDLILWIVSLNREFIQYEKQIENIIYGTEY